MFYDLVELRQDLPMCAFRSSVVILIDSVAIYASKAMFYKGNNIYFYLKIKDFIINFGMGSDYNVNTDYCYACNTDYDFIGHSVRYRADSHFKLSK